MEIASDWSKKKLRVNPAHSLEVLGFLQLLTSYGLASDFNFDYLWKYSEIISRHSQAPKLSVSLVKAMRLVLVYMTHKQIVCFRFVNFS